MWLRCVHGCLVGGLVIALAGCQPEDGLAPDTAVGGSSGAAAGGLLAAAADADEAAGPRAALRGLLGAGIAHGLDPRSQFLQADAVDRTLTLAPSGAAMTWSNPDNGIHGAVSPMRTYRNAAGDVCRELQQTVTIGGQQEQAYGTACRQPDGTWRMVN